MTSKAEDNEKGFAQRKSDNIAAEKSKPTPPKHTDPKKDVKDENGDHPAGLVPKKSPDTTMRGHEAPRNPDEAAQQALDARATDFNNRHLTKDDMAPNEGAHKETSEELEPSPHYSGPPSAA